jgi:hypothetical protein
MPPMRYAALSCLAALACLHPAAHAADPVQVYLSENELTYVGYLDADANQRLFALYDSLKEKPKLLAIRSRGGDVVPGMELGEWVHAHKLNIKVMEFCLSSCANYVFTAGARKIVSNMSMIGFHGGLSSTDFNVGGSDKEKYEAMTPDQKAAFRANIRKGMQPAVDREKAFFQSIGVRQDITTWGQQPRFDNIDAAGWTFTQEGFRHFGVDGIEVINPPWTPKLLTIPARIVTLPAS